MIFRAQLVVVNSTGKNLNVLYETGTAHTLGNHVIPITQSLENMPFDMRHHRALKYLRKRVGVATLEEGWPRSLSSSVSPPLRWPLLPLLAQPSSEDDISF